MSFSDVIAIIALIISIVTAIGQVLHESRQNKISLNSYYFNEIYRDHLIKKIPQARKLISIDLNGAVVGYHEMIDEMKNIQNDSLFYKYSDLDYFKELTKSAQELEDYLIASSGKTYIDENVADFYIQLQKLLTELYSILNKKYIN